ncbi:MAG: monovalent cation/H+ antiporter subunit D family protein [Pseudomonadota bacterium]
MSFASQLPVLPIVIPLIAAPIAILLPKGRAPWAFATLVAWAVFAACLALLHNVAAHGVISYALGDWAPPIGIEYRIDLANAIVLTLVSGIAALVFPFSFESVSKEIDPRQASNFYGALLICFTGLLGVTITGDAFNVFVFLEISSLSTYALIALGARSDRRALTASFNYLIMGTIGATFFVIGIGLLYQATGTLNMADLRTLLSGQDNRVVQAGFAFILVGVGLKLAMFPMHLWLPNAYTYAPSVVSAFIAATATKVAVYVLVRFIYTVFGLDFSFMQAAFAYVLLPLGVIGMFAASIVAVFQEDVKRLLAYSSVGQIGYILLGLGVGTEAGLAASLVHVVNHGLMKGALFMAVACVVYRLGSSNCGAFDGLARRMPFTAAAFIFSGLSLVGVPLTVGFISKWYLLSATFDAGYAWAAFLVVASSLVAVVYVGRIVELILLKPVPEEGPFAGDIKEAPLSMLIPMWLLVAANIYFGVRTEFTASIAEQAAAALAAVAGGAP